MKQKLLRDAMLTALLLTLAGCSENEAPQSKTVGLPLVLAEGDTLTRMQAEEEPNNLAAEANTVIATESLFGDLTPGADVIDLYRFRLSEERVYRFSLSGSTEQMRLAIVDTETGQRVEAGNGTVDVMLARDRDYLIEVGSDDSGPVQQDYDVGVFQSVTERTPPDRCENNGVPCP